MLVFRWWLIETYQQGSLGGESSWRFSVLVKWRSISTISIIMSTTCWNWDLKYHKLLLSPNILVGSYTFSLLTTTVSQTVTTLHEQFGQVEGLWFDSYIVMVTIFIQPQLKTCPRFVPQSFVTSSVISVVSVAYTPASVHRSFYIGLAHTISSSLAGQLW